MSKITVEFTNENLNEFATSNHSFINSKKPFEVDAEIGNALIAEGVFKVADKPKKTETAKKEE